MTTGYYGFSDAADLFIFISGYTVAFVFARRMREHGFIIGSTRELRSLWMSLGMNSEGTVHREIRDGNGSARIESVNWREIMKILLCKQFAQTTLPIVSLDVPLRASERPISRHEALQHRSNKQIWLYTVAPVALQYVGIGQ